MTKKTPKMSENDIINGLYKAIWAISDSIGVSLEVIDGKIPQKHIDPHALARRLLVDCLAQIRQSIDLLDELDIHLKMGHHRSGTKTSK